uniref:Uncharacterized protein n=1 Tax=Pectinophora gossypiella TaxID=13191 RepID=A0A1E1W3W5_PECGO
MGKGKKKDKKKGASAEKEEPMPALDTLSISEASTSRETSAPPEAVAPIPETPKEPVKAPEKEDDDEGGLGLGKRRNKPRKKKSQVAGQHPPAATGPAPAALSPTDAVTAPAPPTAWGAGRGRGQQPQSPPGYQQAGPPVIQQAGPSGYQQAGPPGYRQAGPQAVGPFAPPGFQPGYPGFEQPGRPRQPGPARLPSPQPAAAPTFPGLPAQSRQPALPSPSGFPRMSEPRGRGVGRGQAPMARPQAPGAGPSQPTPSAAQRAPAPSQQQLVAAGDRFRIPHKIPGNGVRYISTKLITNYLPMTIKPLKVHRYDVSFKPDRPKKMIPLAFKIAKQKNFPNHVIAFDQMKNCYALQPLPNVPQVDRLNIPVEFLDNNGKTMNFEVSFKATGIVDLSTIMNYMKTGGTSLNPPTEAIQCVDVILRQGTLESYIKAGRQFFKRPTNPINLGDGLEMWTGLFQSAIFTSSAFVNIDVAHKGFPKQQPLIDAVVKDFRLDPYNPIKTQRGRGVENFQLFVKGLRVMATVGGDTTKKGQKREFICNELVDPPNKLKFIMTDPNGKQIEMTVADYFLKIKNIRLRYPNQNCMSVGPRDRNIYYPLELLEVSYGQAQNKQLNDMQLSTMVKEAATPPNERKRKIEEVISDMNYSRNPDFKHFGLEIGQNFVQVDAKVLTPPVLDVGGNPVRPSRGAWQANRLLKPEALSSWGLIAIELDVHASNGQQILNLMRNVGGELGMSVSEPQVPMYNVHMRDLQNVLENFSRKARFLIIIVPTRGRDYYHKVKQMAEIHVGILTQCIKEATASRRMNPQTVRNILLKVNSKLMGINQALDKQSIPRCIAEGGVMVVGADVTHPSPDQTSVPSIAAVTASIDPKCFIYNIQLSIQTPKKEMIVEFEDMMVEHLRVYAKTQGGYPRKIYVFRDGVSEGQFAQVMNSELQAVHKAYQRLNGPQRKPEVLFLLVQKRHHTRFFNPDSRKAAYNVEPGTVVDTHIVHARELDFYLVSHQAIKGTARPTRYHAVCNDGRIPDDEVEQLTFYLCHLYSRCMRSVSYPTPTYYAHLACLRARSLTHGEKFNNEDLEQNPRRLKVLDRMLEFSRMFFV